MMVLQHTELYNFKLIDEKLDCIKDAISCTITLKFRTVYNSSPGSTLTTSGFLNLFFIYIYVNV